MCERRERNGKKWTNKGEGDKRKEQRKELVTSSVSSPAPLHTSIGLRALPRAPGIGVI